MNKVIKSFIILSLLLSGVLSITLVVSADIPPTDNIRLVTSGSNSYYSWVGIKIAHVEVRGPYWVNPTRTQIVSYESAQDASYGCFFWSKYYDDPYWIYASSQSGLAQTEAKFVLGVCPKRRTHARGSVTSCIQDTSRAGSNAIYSFQYVRMPFGIRASEHAPAVFVPQV